MLKKSSLLLTVIGILICGQTVRADDWALWSNLDLSGKLNDNWTWKVAPQVRFENHFSEHHYTHFELGLSYKLSAWFGIAPSYRHVLTRGSADWNTEKRPQLDLNLSRKWLGLNWSDRNRFEFRFRDSGESVRYRNKLTAKFPQWRVMDIQPYVANEIFYDLKAESLNKNRIYAGASAPVFQDLRVEIGYIRESNKGQDDWSGFNVLWTSLKYGF